MATAKVQCWDFKKCGHDKDHSCLAVTQSAGRSCWLVAGTLNGGKVLCQHAATIGDCKSCDFYSNIKQGRI